MDPPWQPSSTLSHETSSCSEMDSSVPNWLKIAPSIEPVVENAQHEPHCAWFFTGVTAPFFTQSTESPDGGDGGVGGEGGVPPAEQCVQFVIDVEHPTML